MRQFVVKPFGLGSRLHEADGTKLALMTWGLHSGAVGFPVWLLMEKATSDDDRDVEIRQLDSFV